MDDLANSSNQLLLSGLPPELLRIILSFSSDFQSLLSAIASCRALYHAFHSFPGPLVTSVLNREFDPTLLPEIIRIIDARKLRQSSLAEPQLSDAIQRLIHREGETAHEWTLSEGIAAVQLDAVVRDLANAVAEEFLKTIQRYIHRGHEGAPSSAELRRIRLALYRFEAYRVMFPPVVQTVWPPFEVRANWATFFQVYTPWEIEQLGSVHESLFCLIGTAPENAATMSGPNQRTPLYYHDPSNPSYQSKDSHAKAGYSLSSGGHGAGSQYGGSAASGTSTGQQGGGGQNKGYKNPAWFQGFQGNSSGGKK
ncbi:hypothetical protein CkaCkLH20_03654 [Colletotrichum karsti]|uniref:F-box domain-containing protein n=1 Tax=Colletotrichum karsti TaxID=1095194 RepID=A0A9P6IA37_9PEZI|nr:uncharacterized protein CkaCkLH20_03654 [Colletotrichum karsti]KAF9878754.1 hypothetical protein CkaCkLH20_03654 [Colletotrichum karsti]